MPSSTVDLAAIVTRWPPAPAALLDAGAPLDGLPIDHEVRPGPLSGGPVAGARRLQAFLDAGLDGYLEARDHPDLDAGSGLSPYLHFGHVAAHQVLEGVLTREGWTPERLSPRAIGAREGWWGLSPSAEAFLDQAITWRELGFNMSDKRADADQFDSLPPWAIATLEKHAADPREHLYSLDAFAAASTHDPLWNAAQRQLLTEGRLHNYLRMLWGKKILEWTRTPREALGIMVELNNKYALDGRDPNSASGIFWVLGRYDRPWGPERPVFGTVRYMSSENAARKLRVREYLRRHS
jgi:deoxyribodipyrimidine photo-lyase